MPEASTEPRQLRVVVADDDTFTLSLVGDGLRAQGFTVHAAPTAEEAATLVAEVDAHALVTDLNFGQGMSGASLLRLIREEHPWVGLVVLTSHQSPQLAVDDPDDIPSDAVYLVKSQLHKVEQLAEAVRKAIAGQTGGAETTTGDSIVITSGQAEVLRLLAGGASAKAIADRRGTTVRAAEAMINRLYLTLGLDPDSLVAQRVAAINLWQQGRIRVR